MSYNIKISSIDWPFYGSAPYLKVILDRNKNRTVHSIHYFRNFCQGLVLVYSLLHLGFVQICLLRNVLFLLMSQTTLKSDNPDLCPQKNLVLGIIFGNLFNTTTSTPTPHDIHRWRAMNQSYLLTLCNQFAEIPTSTPNSVHTVRLNPALILTQCPK